MQTASGQSRKRTAEEGIDNIFPGASIPIKEPKIEEVVAADQPTIVDAKPKNQLFIKTRGADHPKWLGTHRHLQAAIAAIDDRLLFLRICEELDAKGIRYEQICVEPLVGGHMLKLTDVSSLVRKHGVECEDFFQNLLHCNIRMNLPDGGCHFECTFINPPLVPDFERSDEEVTTDKQKPHTWILTISSQSKRELVPSLSQMIAHSIEDRMLVYCHIYVPVRRFADAYNAFYTQFCSVRTFTYHKFVLIYGEQRDLLFVLSWRWHWQARAGKYALCFGQAPRPGQNRHPSEAKRRWNPHILVSQLLVERFNRDRDLTWLVNYLVNTHRSLNTIHQFVRTQMRSTKIAAQVLGTEAMFPAELMCYLVPVDEFVIRLSYGPHISMEFMLLQDNQVAIRDCSVGPFSFSGGDGGVSLADFWRAHQQQQTSEEENVQNSVNINNQS